MGTENKELTRLEALNVHLDREVVDARCLLIKVTEIREKLMGPTVETESSETKKACNPNCLLDELEDKLSTLSALNVYINQELNKLTQVI